jgi:hypothetical protein
LPSPFLANPILCCAAVLLVPQALECCGDHPRTVLEGLAQGAEIHHESLRGHSADEHRERLSKQLDHVIADETSRTLARHSGVSLQTGHETGETPTTGAGISLGEQCDGLQGGPDRLAEGDRHHAGRMVQPATPPPRRAI